MPDPQDGSVSLNDFGPNEWLVDELYQQYKKDRNLVDKAWWDFFEDLPYPRPSFDALQVPPTHGPLVVVDERFVEAAHAHGVEVHVWTIDDPAEMRRLVSLGVDGIMTDEPARLLEVLGRRRDEASA